MSQHSLKSACRVRPANAFVEWKKEGTDCSVPYHFRRQALAYPERTAVKTDNQEVIYRALDSAANRIAQAMLAKRGKAQAPVALLVENGLQMFEAMLGALKAGKFYSPLDPSYPVERNKYIADDLGAELIVTNNKNLHLAERLVKDRLELINLDELNSSISDEDPDLCIKPDDIAFVHYTSGSTGQPKGVIYAHRHVLHAVLRYTNGQHISSDDRLSLLSSYSYGASIGNIFGGLLNGVAICVFDLKEEGFDRLARWLINEEITIYYSVPTVFRHFASTLTGEERFPKLRLIRLGGETVYRDDVELYKKHFDENCLLHIGLGATETNLVREYFFDKQTECNTDIAPVGYAVEDVEVFLLDDAGQSVGFDCTGEIAVRSRYISSGYWRRPELTEKAFLPDPEGKGKRTYLTGDLGFMLQDGCLMHLGRKDSQVKIRGFRIEAAEIETALLNLKEVKEAAVTSREGHNGEKRLVAHVALESESRLNPPELRAALRQSLPDFMIPAAFIILDELPRTPVGKVDRNQLLSLSPARQTDQSSYIAPRNTIESRLAQIWEQILGAGPIGVRDDFFNLGGDSLAAAELFAEIDAIYGRSIPASAMLQASTIEQIAELIEIEEQEFSSLVPIRTSGSNPPFFCVHGIGGDVISFRDLANHLGEDQPFYGLRARAGVADRFRVEAIAAHYMHEMQRHQPDGPYFIGGYSFGGTVAFEMARQLTAQGKTVGVLAMFDTYGPGYPKLLPVRKRLVVHLRKMLQAETPEKLRYLRERIDVNAIRIRRSMKRSLYDFTMSVKGRPPETVAKNLETTHQQASRNYVPKPYRGKMDLFKATDRKEIWQPDPLLGWGGLAAGGIQVHDIPGDHITLIAEPNARMLAEKLSERINEARR